ncbi:MAG: MazG family protein [Nitriliruptoraceae bacterium]
MTLSATARVVLVESSDAVPGLFPFQSWDVLGTASHILVRDVADHPSALHLHAAGLDLRRVEPATLDRADLDLSRPGSADDRRIAKRLLEFADADAPPVYLLGPDDTGLAAALAGLSADRDVEIELVFFAPQPRGVELVRIVEVMAALRDPASGCPWDLEQDHHSLVRYLLEETYELVDAIERDVDTDMVEELGDVLLQVVFHAQVASDRGAFTVDDVARGIADKLVHRHPHVFGDGDAKTAQDVQDRWEALKAEEKGRTGPFDGVPAAMPGLLLLDKILHKAHKAGLEPTNGSGDHAAALARLDSLDVTADDIGAALQAIVALARTRGIDAERAARQAANNLRSDLEQLDTTDRQ